LWYAELAGTYLARSLPHNLGVARRQTAQRDSSVARDLQIEEDLDFQNREWQVQRAGWAILGLVTVLALVGIFGAGIISSASLEANGLRLEYERFGRLRRPESLRISFEAQEGGRLLISRDYLDHFTVEDISPRPDRVEAAAGWLVYHFTAHDGGVSAIFRLQPEEFGRISGAVRLAQAEPIAFRQFIYP